MGDLRNSQQMAANRLMVQGQESGVSRDYIEIYIVTFQWLLKICNIQYFQIAAGGLSGRVLDSRPSGRVSSLTGVTVLCP